MDTIIDCYREADEEKRLDLFLSFRDLRNDFIAIQLQEYQVKKREAAHRRYRPRDACAGFVNRLKRSFMAVLGCESAMGTGKTGSNPTIVSR